MPELPQDEKERGVLISEWLGHVCSQIFSYGFYAYTHDEMNLNEVKIFCSESILLQIITLIKERSLSEAEITKINTTILQKILKYSLLKYPQSTEEGEMWGLGSLIVERDDSEDPANDLFQKSGVNFTLKDKDENYNGEIMKFLNFIIEMTNERNYKMLKSEK